MNFVARSGAKHISLQIFVLTSAIAATSFGVLAGFCAKGSDGSNNSYHMTILSYPTLGQKCFHSHCRTLSGFRVNVKNVSPRRLIGK